ncbi:MAG: hypothetical protein ACLQPD_33920 [Desulfomonilaceae bacterium]
MKLKRSGRKIKQVELPPNGGGAVGVLAVIFEAIYSLAGLIVALIFLAGGIFLLLSGIRG